jgi:predicted Zn-dependent protease
MKTFKPLYISICCLVAFSYNDSNAAIFNHNKLWDYTDLRVCFANIEFGTGSDDASKSLRGYGETQVEFSTEKIELISETLKSEFTKENTGIELSGFAYCEKGRKTDVVIIGSAKFQKGRRNALAHSTVGQRKNGVQYIVLRVNKNKTEEKFKNNIKHNQIFSYIVTHEMGHVLGMKHDHEMAIALADPFCQKLYLDKGKTQKTNHLFDGGMFGDIESTNYKSYNGYDSKSVMNYCFVFDKESRNSRNTFLSPIDKEALLSIYSHIY